MVEGVLTVNGFSFSGTGQSAGLIFIKLKHWDERSDSSQSMGAFLGRTNKYFASIKEANVIAVPPPAVLELGNTGGFDMMLQNRGGLSHDQFLEARNQLLGAAQQNPALVNVRANGVEDAPQFKLDIDREKATRWVIPLADIKQTRRRVWGPRTSTTSSPWPRQTVSAGDPTSRIAARRS